MKLVADWRRVLRRAWSREKKEITMKDYRCGEGRKPRQVLSPGELATLKSNSEAISRLPADGLIHVVQYPS